MCPMRAVSLSGLRRPGAKCVSALRSPRTHTTQAGGKVHMYIPSCTLSSGGRAALAGWHLVAALTGAPIDSVLVRRTGFGDF